MTGVRREFGNGQIKSEIRPMMRAGRASGREPVPPGGAPGHVHVGERCPVLHTDAGLDTSRIRTRNRQRNRYSRRAYRAKGSLLIGGHREMASFPVAISMMVGCCAILWR